jgi:xylulokinase
METKAAEAEVGSEGLVVIPFGNGAERMMLNQDPKAHIEGL